eukprot:6366721-Lingulodinium_polyedra.AAC.1
MEERQKRRATPAATRAPSRPAAGNASTQPALPSSIASSRWPRPPPPGFPRRGSQTSRRRRAPK